MLAGSIAALRFCNRFHRRLNRPPRANPELSKGVEAMHLRRAQPPRRRAALRRAARSLTQRIASRLVLASPRTTCLKASSTRFIPTPLCTCSQPRSHLPPVRRKLTRTRPSQRSQVRTTIPWVLDRCVRSVALCSRAEAVVANGSWLGLGLG